MDFSVEVLKLGIIWYIIFLFSTTLHEASHAFFAYKFGDRTAYEGGQVTLNPIPHIKREPFGMVIIPIIVYLLSGWMLGWASAPYNLVWALQYPRRSSLMALAGPMANFILVLIAAGLIHLGIALGWFYPPESINFTTIVASYNAGIFSIIAKFISIMFSLNLILFLFNLLPIPPLDGSSAFSLFLPKEKARKYLQFIKNPAFAIFGIFIAWKLFDYIYISIFLFAINLLYPWVSYI